MTGPVPVLGADSGGGVAKAGDVLGFGSGEPAPPGGTLARFVGDDWGIVRGIRYDVTVGRQEFDGERWAWNWAIFARDAGTNRVCTGEQLFTPWNYSSGTILRILADFLDAHAESDGYPGSENSDLFDHSPELSRAVSDEIRDVLGWDSWGED